MSSKPFFDRIAPEWDRVRSTLFSEAVRQKAFAVAGLQPGRLAADIGAGTGFLTEGLVAADLRVIAVDQSEAMLQELQRKVGPEKGVDCRLGEAQALPIGDASVDYVFANMFLHHVESPPDAIAEMARILKPGGRLVITDMDEHPYEFLRHKHQDRWLGFKRDDILNWLQQAGLKDANVDCLEETCCTESTAGAEVVEVSIFVATAVK